MTISINKSLHFISFFIQIIFIVIIDISTLNDLFGNLSINVKHPCHSFHDEMVKKCFFERENPFNGARLLIYRFILLPRFWVLRVMVLTIRFWPNGCNKVVGISVDLYTPSVKLHLEMIEKCFLKFKISLVRLILNIFVLNDLFISTILIMLDDQIQCFLEL